METAKSFIESALNQKLLDKTFDACLNSFSGFSELCFLLCGLFAFGYFAKILAKTWAKGEPIDLNALWKPFIVGVIVMNFNWVYTIIDGVFDPIESYTEAVASRAVSENEENVERMAKARASYAAEYELAQEGLDVWDSMTNWFSNMGNNLLDIGLYILNFIVTIVLAALRITIRIFSLAFKLVLILFGPLAFAMSLLPSFEDNWKGWIAKYINVCLFIPIANVVDFIVAKLSASMYQMQIENYDKARAEITSLTSDTLATPDFLFSAEVTYLVFLVVFCALYLMIPKLTNMIVERGSMHDSAAALQAGTVALATAGMVAGKSVAHTVAASPIGSMAGKASDMASTIMSPMVQPFRDMKSNISQGLDGVAAKGNAMVSNMMGHIYSSGEKEMVDDEKKMKEDKGGIKQ